MFYAQHSELVNPNLCEFCASFTGVLARLGLSMPKRGRAYVEGQQTLDGKRAAASVKGTEYIPLGRPGRPLSAQEDVNGKRQCPVCEHWFTKLHLHYSESFTFQDKSLKHLPGREFWTDWHPEPLCRVENKGTLPLPRIVD